MLLFHDNRDNKFKRKEKKGNLLPNLQKSKTITNPR